jgi:hypothetical protein
MWSLFVRQASPERNAAIEDNLRNLVGVRADGGYAATGGFAIGFD